MKVPYRESAIVKKTKIVGFLLSLTHEDGKSKARFFRKMGFNDSNIEQFINCLLEVVRCNDVDISKVRKDEFATRYLVVGLIKAPNGKKYYINTIWAIERGSKTPHLTTAYPKKRHSV